MARRYRTYTAADIAALTAAAAEARALDDAVRAIMAETDALIEAVIGREAYPGWELYHPELQPIIAALDTDAHPFATANTSYIPQEGHIWHHRWNPTTWQARNRRTRRDITNLRKAIETVQRSRS